MVSRSRTRQIVFSEQQESAVAVIMLVRAVKLDWVGTKLDPGPISKLVYFMISLLACSEFHCGIFLAEKNLLV